MVDYPNNGAKWVIAVFNGEKWGMTESPNLVIGDFGVQRNFSQSSRR